MAKFDADRIKKILVSSRDRVVIVLLLVAIVGVFYQVTNITAGGIDGILAAVLPETPARPPGSGRPDPAPVVQGITEGQDINEWKPIMPPKDPFTSQEKKQRILQTIRSEYQRGLRAINEQDFEQAIVHFRACLEMDRFQAAEEIYDDGLPSNLIRQAENQNVRDFVQESITRAEQLTEQAESSEAGGQLEQALDFYTNIEKIARDALEREGLEVVDTQLIEQLREILAESTDKVSQLRKIVFHDIISRLHDTARDNYAQFNNASSVEQQTAAILDLLVQVRDDLEDAIRRIEQNPDLADRVPESEQNEIETFLQQVREDIEDRIPGLVQHVEELTAAGEAAEDLDQLNEALALVDILDALQPGTSMTERRNRVQTVKDKVEVEVARKEIEQLLSRVQQQVQTIKTELEKSPADWDRIESLKQDGYTALNRANEIRSRFSELAGMLQRITQLRTELDAIEILPPVPNAVYVENVRNRVFNVLVEGSLERLTKGRCEPYPVGRGDRICLTQISEDFKTIWVEVPGKYRETELQCQECED